MDGMNMGDPSSNSTTGTMSSMMVPYLHFTGGDFLFFRSLQPTSVGALIGASIVLFFLALLERGLSAVRASLEVYWGKRAFVRSSQDDTQLETSPLQSSGSLLKSSEDGKIRAAELQRTVPPFIPAHDIPRGMIHAFQMFLTYALMLAVMTFQAAYIIAIILGLGVGEIMVGRFSGGRHSLH